MIAAADRAIGHHALGQGNLPVRAAILQSEDRLIFRPHHHDGLSGETRRVTLAGLHLPRPGDRIPMVGMRADAAEIVEFAFTDVSYVRHWVSCPAIAVEQDYCTIFRSDCVRFRTSYRFGRPPMKAWTTVAAFSAARVMKTSMRLASASPPARSERLRKAMKGTPLI